MAIAPSKPYLGQDCAMGGIAVGVDVGGTFTDLVAVVDGELRTAKVPTVPGDEGAGVDGGAGCVGDRRPGDRGARARDDRRHERAARAARRADGARHDRGLPRRDRDRPAEPALALRPDRGPAAAARPARAPVHGRASASGRRACSSRWTRRASTPRSPRCRGRGRGGRRLPALLLPPPRARARASARRSGQRCPACAVSLSSELLAGVPRVRALLDDGRERVPRARLLAALPGSGSSAASRS